MTNQQANDQQARIAREFLGLIPCPIHEDHWYTVETWHVDPVRRGEPFRLPSAGDARWGGMIKAEIEQRNLALAIHRFPTVPAEWVVQIEIESWVRGDGLTENLALMAAVLALLGSEK